MLSRHYFRAKVMQVLYACQLSQTELRECEQHFANQIAQLNTLGILQLSLLTEFRRIATLVMEEGQHKYIPTEEERNPSRRFVDNQFITHLEENKDYTSFVESTRIDWTQYEDMFRKAFATYRTQPFYTDYIKQEEVSADKEKQFAIRTFRYVVNDEGLRTCICDRNLLWEDDFDQIAQYNFMMLKSMNEDFGADTPLPLMFDKRNEKDRDAYAFAQQLLHNAYLNREESHELIRNHLKGWDFERVAQMDILLINMAITELTCCESIPERVTVDEYIELSKEYSTDRSKLFINGILDKIIIVLRSAGRINKTGRGLYNPDNDNEQQEES